MANVISMAQRIAVLNALVEGCSVRSTVRMTGVSKGAILRLLVSVGTACAEYQDKALRNITSKRVQVDEIWSFVGAKQKNATEKNFENGGYAGDVWTFVALDADTKLAISWRAGYRDAGTATPFLQDVESRLSNRVQLTTDGHKMYLQSIPDALGSNIDFAQLVKIFGNTAEGQRRYSPAMCLGTKKIDIIGQPDHQHISTSYIERQNLTMRMGMRRFTRLTNAFSKKLDNHIHALSLFYLHYNFVRIHQTLRITPAMAAGLSHSPWTVADIAGMGITHLKVMAA
jgi:IS1 family transposase